MNALSELEAIQRLRAASSARLLALDADTDEVYIVPVNFACLERSIYFYTEPGRKLTVLQRHPDGAGLQTDGPTWSVLVTGRYRPAGLAERALCTAALLAKYRALAVAPMWGKARGQWRPFLRELSRAQVGVIPIRAVSGRQWA